MNLPFLKSPQGETPVIVEAEFAVSAARLFQAWTTPAEIKQWFGSEEGGPKTVEVDLQVGGAWQFVFPEHDGQTDSLEGKYLQIEQSKLLEFSWVHTRKLAGGTIERSAESLVTVRFESRGEGSFSRLVHSLIEAESSRSNIGGGWNASFAKIKRVVE